MYMNSIDFNDLGDQCKRFEQVGTYQAALPDTILMSRLDGRAFHSLTSTRKFIKPYDEVFINVMVETAKEVMKEFHPTIAYVQSDEISLCWMLKSDKSQFPFNGKFHKINSVVASYCSVKFNSLLSKGKDIQDSAEVFDCRTWYVPNKIRAAEVFLWRQLDAERNSINMLAHATYSNKELDGLGTNARLQKLDKDGIVWGNYLPNMKHGTLLFFKTSSRNLTDKELSVIPEPFRPTGPVLRRDIVENYTRLNTIPDAEGIAEFLFADKG